MAARYWVGGTANWDNTAGTKWALTSGGAGGAAVPTASDDVFLDAASGVVTVSLGTGATCLSLNCTGFTGTLAGSSQLGLVNDITFSSGMTITSTSNIRKTGGGSMTSNGKTWTGSFEFVTGGATVTLVDNWTINGTLWAGNAVTLNGNNIYLNGSLNTQNGILGTTNFHLTGTGTWSRGVGGGAIQNNLTINTTGAVTISGIVSYNTGTLTYLAGTVITTGSTLTIAAATVLNTNGITWNNVAIYTGTSFICAFLSDFTMIGNFTGTGSPVLNGLYTFYMGGNYTQPNGSLSGTMNIVLNGTSLITGSSNAVFNNLTINTAGTITFASGSTFTYGVNTLRYITGTVVTTNHTLSIYSSCTLNTSGITWNNVNNFATGIVTLTSNLNLSGTFRIQTATGTLNGFNVNCSGSLLVDSGNNTSGTTLVNLTGTGTWSGSGNFRNNLTINTVGTITIAGTVGYNTGTLTYTAGTVTTTGSTLNISNPTTTVLNTSGITWNNITTGVGGAGGIITLTSNLSCTGTFTNQNTTTFNGNTFNIGGSILTSTNGYCQGTTNFVLNGIGTWSGSAYIQNNLTINTVGIITIAGTVSYNTGTLTVESGATVNTSNSTLIVQANATTTFDIGNIKLNNFSLGGSSTVNTLQLNSPLYIIGTAFLGAGSQAATINGSPVYIESGVLSSSGGNQGPILGTSQILMTGDKATYLDAFIGATTGANGQGVWRIPITINIRGTFLMFGRLVLSTGGSLNIQNGNVENRDGVVNRASLLVQANTTLTNVHKCKFKIITITAGVTLTMNEFFTGSPEFKSIIRSTSTSNYTVTFTDRVPKKAFHVNVRNCNVTQTLVRNQLNIINRDGNAGFNTGIIFGESGMCGFPLNKFPTEVSYPTDNGFKNGFN